MKYLSILTKYKVFSRQDFAVLINDDNLAKITIQNYLKKGYIARIKHNLYGVVSLETNECIADKFLIASNITETSFVSHHSAFEFYGYYNPVYNDVTVSSISKFNGFEFQKNKYYLIQVPSTNFVEEIRGIRVTSIERTIVDCIKDSGKYCELEEILNCINLIPYISINDILKYLEEINSKMLYKKVGVVLSIFKDKLNIPDSFFEKCHKVSDSIKGYFDNNKKAHVYNSEWKIFIYKDLNNYITKEESYV